ncbi:hypothetical protein AC578_6644 [Pseudocercospora eumusae]|uniref:SET domain-containing protein n=1 Tax=Pseudocercospora eumusae TaxID=321146 RepID=A0A139HFY0_9PEZI|nr:hypothetical protein AC578_6644 [Pseudocercospora eumusae]
MEAICIGLGLESGLRCLVTVHSASFALMPISKGEEITIAYSSLYYLATKAQRAGPSWMFQCHCPACSLEPKEQWTSDTRRRLSNVLFPFLHGKSAPDLSIMEALATTMTPQQAERPKFLAMVNHHGAPL